MKKLLAILLAAVMLVSFVACSDTPAETTPSGTEATDVTTGGTSSTDNTTGTSDETTVGTGGTDETTASSGIDDPQPTEPDTGAGRQWVKVGKYVTFLYNATTCDATYEVKKGLGSRETVTFTVKMKDGYTFDGWSTDKSLAEAPEMAYGKNTTFTFEAAANIKIFLNTSMTLTYDANGGSFKNGFDGTQSYSLVYYENPNTLPEKGYFGRDGYTLVGYNTEADGSGEFVTLGGKLQNHYEGSTTLYCVWEKNTPEADFELDKTGATITILKYKGTDTTVVIPELMAGKKVTRIAEGAFSDSNVTCVVVGKTVSMIEPYAFENCKELQRVVLFDASFGASGGRGQPASYGVSKNSFSGCDKLDDVCINTIYTLTSEWMSSTGAQKLDRLIWAKDKKKIIIVGGSGSWMGFDGQVLYDALNGEYEIVNMGENANISAVLYFDLIEHFVKEGDIVLWCPEPGNYTLGQRTMGSGTYGFDFRKSDYQFARYINLSLYDNFFEVFSSYSAKLGSTAMKPFDTASASMDASCSDGSPYVWNNVIESYNFRYNTGAENELKGLFANIREKGASIYFSFAAMQKSGIEKVKEQDILGFEKIITEKLGVVSISDYKNLILEDDMFYNSAWHLSAKGRPVRSERVAADIKAQLAKEGK